METNTEGNLLEVMDLARTLRQEQLFIQQEQTTFAQLTEALAENSAAITKLAYICAQQRRNLNDLIVSRPDIGPSVCCRRAKNYDNIKFIDAKKVLDYEHAIAYEDLFNYLYKSPYVLALSLATGDSLADISPAHMNSVIQTVTSGLFGNVINTKDVEMVLKILRELIEIQIVVSDNPRRLLRENTSTFARIYHRLNESMFSAKIFLTAALFQPIMSVLSETDMMLDVDPKKVIQSLSLKEKIRRFGFETSASYQEKIDKFHIETINQLFNLVTIFIDSLHFNWSLFPSTLRWLIQTMCHQLKHAHQFSDKAINEILNDMVFTQFICPAIVSPDVMGIIDAPIPEQVRFNLIQIGQIIQMLALAKHGEIDPKFIELYSKFETNNVTKLIDLLLVTQSGEDVVAILAQQSDFERAHLLVTQQELNYLTEFYRILTVTDEFHVSEEEKEKLKKILKHLPESSNVNGNPEGNQNFVKNESSAKEKSKQSLKNLSKSTKSKIAKSMSFSNVIVNNLNSLETNVILNGIGGLNMNGLESTSSYTSSMNSSPVHSYVAEVESEPVLIFNLYNGVEQKLQPLSEEEVLKMNSIGQDISNGELAEGENYQPESTVDKSSVANGFDGMSDILRPMHGKTARFSLSHDDGSIGNSDNLEAVSEVPSNHSVTSSLELEENVENDNLSDMVSANVSGRGTPNISGRDTPSSQVTDGDSINNALPTPQMQKLISKARSDIQDKFCKFEIKKFEGDETVSIISDTWSTDVLASDSETVDTTERERERNLSTPLIPASVVLPGDNNFDVLSSAGGMRTGYLDVSDQRSESNWSTDVLASDSEKLNELDTDDNVSITAKSDILVSNAVSERKRKLLATIISVPTNRQQRLSNNAHYSVARSSRSFRLTSSNAQGSHKLLLAKVPSSGSVDDVHCSGGSSGGNASDRSQEDSAFFDAINSYDDNSASVTINSHYHHHYRDGSSLARSSVRTSNQLENTFQQNYKSITSEKGKDNFLQAGHFTSSQRMRRQASAESSLSNQSVNLEEHSASVTVSSPFASNSKNRPKSVINNESKDLIDFSDFCDDKHATPPSLALSDPPLPDIFQDDVVEHRESSILHRFSGDDGRRNGILALNGDHESSESCANLISSLRRHQSLDYENHEIMLNSVPKRNSGLPIISSQTDEDRSELQEQKQEILHLTNKTSDLKLNDTTETNGCDLSRETPASERSSAGIMVYSSPLTAKNQKPTKSTGAIPKSISFDASADKANCSSTSSTTKQNRNVSRFQLDPLRIYSPSALNNLTITNSGIFNKLKQGIFKHRRGQKPRHNSTTHCDEISQSSRSVSFSNNTSEVSLDIVSANMGNGCTTGAQERNAGYFDINEDILAKYRRKVSTSSETTNSSNGNGAGAVGGLALNGITKDVGGHQNKQYSTHDKIMAFNLVKKKVRTVLSKTDLHSGDFRHTTHTNISPLLTYLQIQLAQAINLQNFQQISYVSEAIRCISQLDVSQHTQIMDELQNDIQKRQSYLQYLMRYRQNLLMIMENVGQYESRLKNESSTCNRYLMALCIRLFFEKKQNKIKSFQENFIHLTVSDDKIDLIEEFIEDLMEELLAAGGILNGMPEWQTVEARMSLERILLQSMYQQVMFPNEDADLSRDSVLSDHIRKLQNIITPSHPSLCIPLIYLSEAPWSFAQQELKFISAYKTPREKLNCVIRCISSIMSLLHMSSGRVPASDDILPVLIYVLVMANPPYLLSTVEYITCFIGDKLDGEAEFHWTLFCSVVKFIKTMDYSDQ